MRGDPEQKVSKTAMSAHTPTENVNVERMISLTSPRELNRAFPTSDASRETVLQSRATIKSILAGRDSRLLVVAGPCSIHDIDAAMEYAGKLNTLREKYQDKLVVVMRTYFEKPRTTVGWKGLINDPHLDGTFDMAKGLELARKLLLDITEMGLPCGTEMLDPITPQYIDDLVSWASIGARTTESQTHRQMASGLSMPVGFKNGTDGSLKVAMDAMKSAKSPHSFLGIDDEGRTCIVQTKGNPEGFLVLRGGGGKPNYEADTVAAAASKLTEAGLSDRIIVDCSHANSGKKQERQEVVWRSVLEQRKDPQSPIFGAMLESFLVEGRQDIPVDRTELRRGVSVTDECINWAKTEQLLAEAYEALG